uniref:Uncharacterized protein n=1 Tax=Branchiostoma floridae TaxID=7739 RepID=C3YBA3_BRAFL|eukprot:XP_002606250.1 hypothetical protein BRAFLDRAFT_123707 [Branchiostoma floridae]
MECRSACQGGQLPIAKSAKAVLGMMRGRCEMADNMACIIWEYRQGSTRTMNMFVCVGVRLTREHALKIIISIYITILHATRMFRDVPPISSPGEPGCIWVRERPYFGGGITVTPTLQR